MTQPEAIYGSPPQGAWEIANRAVDVLRARLPEDWKLHRFAGIKPQSDRRAAAIVSLIAPDDSRVALKIEARHTVEPRDVRTLGKDRPRSKDAAGVEPGATMIAARYLGSGARRQLIEAGLNYADATGNLYLSLSTPALFLRDVGAERDPWRKPGRPRGSLRGTIASRVVRALADFTPPMTVPELIERSGVSTGAGYRVVDFLERQALLARKARGPITAVEWRSMLELWAEDYELNLEESAVRYLEPRGLEAVRSGLADLDAPDYVVTGSLAASYYEPYAAVRLAIIYTDDPTALADQLDLRPVDTGANVLLLPPLENLVFERSQNFDRLRVAAPSQIVADLLNGPGRAPSEAQALLDWMEKNEPAWRH